MAIEWKRPMKPQPIRPIFKEVTTLRGDASLVVGQAFEYVIERRRYEFGQCDPPVFRRRARSDVAAEQALLEGHQDCVDDVPCDGRGRIPRKLSLVLVATQDRCKGIFP